MSKRVVLQSGIISSGQSIYFDVQDDEGDIYATNTTSTFTAPNLIDYATNGGTTMPEAGSSGQYEADFPITIGAGTYTINMKQKAGIDRALTDQVIKSITKYWDGTNLLDPAYATVVSAGAISPTYVEDAWIWRFEARDQMTASNIINEVEEFEGILGMTFDRIISPNVVIQSALVDSIDEDTGTESGVDVTGNIQLSPNRRTVHIPVLVYDYGDYTFVIKVTTTDSQSYVRRGQLTIQKKVLD